MFSSSGDFHVFDSLYGAQQLKQIHGIILGEVGDDDTLDTSDATVLEVFGGGGGTSSEEDNLEKIEGRDWNI